MSKKKKNKNWSWSTGIRPFVIRVTEFSSKGNLYTVQIKNGKQVMRSLGHRDKELAKAKAKEISAALAKEFFDHQSDSRRRPLRIGELIDAYEKHGLHGRSESYVKEQPRKLRRVADFFGRDREVLSLSKSDVRRYSKARRTGEFGTSVCIGTVWSELTALKIACAWATKRKLLRVDPLVTILIPQGNKNSYYSDPKRILDVVLNRQ